jgi:triosephosphate isomerase
LVETLLRAESRKDVSVNENRRPLIAGNWKMYNGGPAGITLAAECVKIKRELPRVDILIAPPFTVLAAIAHEIDGSGVLLAAQNMHAKASGAFTGEVSVPMLKDAGCGWVLVGHSERRQLFGETDVSVAEKVGAALAGDLSPIVCIGETLAEREAGETLRVVSRQLRAVISLLAAAKIPVALAYEPVWAIGTGKNAGPTEAEEVHMALRHELNAQSVDLAERVRILYGGSVKPTNAAALLACPNVDGALIGGASLEADSFGAIARAAHGSNAR